MEVLTLIFGLIIEIIVLFYIIKILNEPTSNQSSITNLQQNINEMKNLRIFAQNTDNTIPFNEKSKLLVTHIIDKAYLKKQEVKINPNIKGNFILGDDRAFIFSGTFSKHTVGIWVFGKENLRILKDHFDEYWTNGYKPYH